VVSREPAGRLASRASGCWENLETFLPSQD